MAEAIATVTGTAIRPGISRNNRKYTVETIRRMVDRAQARIDDAEGMPITMLTHHAADDDSTQLVGQVTRIWQEEDGAARFEAAIDDTGPGRIIASLADPAGRTKPTLKGVSIRGAWVGRVRRESHPDIGMVEAGDDVELDGLDYTRKPGVVGAVIDGVTRTPAAPRESDGSTRIFITESAPEATVTVTEADASGSEQGPFADPGYQKDKQKRYPVSTKAKAKAAWSYVNQADNARLYTAAQLKRVKQRITKALKGFGVTVAAQEGWLIDPAGQVTESLAECWGMDADDAGNLFVSLTNGPTTVTVTSQSLDPHDLDAVGRAAMDGACQALMNLDPDMDADVDVPGEPDDDSAPASAAGADCPCGCGCAVPATPGGCPCECESCMHCKTDEDDDGGDMGESAHLGEIRVQVQEGLDDAELEQVILARHAKTSVPETPAAEPTQETETAMAESTTPAAETAAAPATGGITLTDEQFKTLLAAVAPQPAPAMESAAAEPVVEAAPAVEVTETEDQRIQRLVTEGIAKALPTAVQEHVEATGPSRKGFVAPVTETSAVTSGLPEGWPQKPLHEYTDEEWRQTGGAAVVGSILGDRAPRGE